MLYCYYKFKSNNKSSHLKNDSERILIYIRDLVFTAYLKNYTYLYNMQNTYDVPLYEYRFLKHQINTIKIKDNKDKSFQNT